MTETDVTWAITGSTAFAMRGVDVVPRDLDIPTDAAGAYAVQRLLAPHIVAVGPVRYRTAPTIRSHFGRAVVAGVSVEIMGAIEKQQQEGPWMCIDVAGLIEWIEWEGQAWPVLALAYEAAAYRALLGMP